MEKQHSLDLQLIKKLSSIPIGDFKGRKWKTKLQTILDLCVL